MMTTRWTRIVAPLALALSLGADCRAQGVSPAGPAQPPQGPVPAGLTSRESIEAEFRRDVAQAERNRLARLAALAAGQPKAEAARTYAELFRFAIASGLYADAEPIAEGLLRTGQPTPEVALLAEMVNLVAEANRGAYEDSLNSLSAAIRIRDQADKSDPGAKAQVKQALPLASRLSLVNIYIQRLIQAAQYDVARKALTMLRDTTKEPAIKALVAARLGQIELIGKPAPSIDGDSIDGKPIRMADFKGDVVLVVFWASWCLPNAEEAERLNAIEAAYRGKGFRVVGINVDAMQDGGVSVETVMPNIRRFLLDHNVSSPTLINGQGGHDYTRAYGVTEIPANVLIGRDGKVIHLDLGRSNLETTIAAALGR